MILDIEPVTLGGKQSPLAEKLAEFCGSEAAFLALKGSISLSLEAPAEENTQ